MRRLSVILLWSSALAAVDLSGEWRRHDGDDPRWAAPDFDDRDWMRVELPMAPARSGRFWLRRQVVLTEAIADPGIALGRFARRYEVYVDGVKAGEALPWARTPYFPPRWFAVRGPWPAGAEITLAIRAEDDVGQGAHAQILPDDGAYWLGGRREAEAATEMTLLKHRHAVLPTVGATALQLTCGVLLFLFWLTGAPRPELRWFAGFVFGVGLFNALHLASAYQEVEWRWPTVAIIAAYGCLSSAATSLSGRLPRVVWPLTALCLLLAATGIFWQRWLELAFTFGPLLPASVWALRQLGERTPLRWAAVSVLLYVGLAFSNGAGTRFGWRAVASVHAGPFHFPFSTEISMAFGLAGSLLMIQNAARERREKARLAGEMDAARRVQQFLIPATAAPGVDAAYLPAAEVGGDFYQVFPLADGGTLVAVGDVSGKGLKAAMVVSMVTGVLRGRRSDDPAELLGELNRALAGSLDSGFITAAIARVHPGGRLTLANAGHPAPYLNGAEVTAEASLPLGILPEAEFGNVEVSLEAGQQLTFVSDGVVEAENAARELFGFERTRALATRPAAKIAEAARAWGQNDDITVVTVRRSIA